jgi:hypothetical protein
MRCFEPESPEGQIIDKRLQTPSYHLPFFPSHHGSSSRSTGRCSLSDLSCCYYTLFDIDLQDLTRQVTVLSHPNENYQWVLGSGGFATVFKGQWRDSRESASQDDPPVGRLSPSHHHLIIDYCYRLMLPSKFIDYQPEPLPNRWQMPRG